MRAMTARIARLTDVIYSAGLEAESEELQEIWNQLVSKFEVVTRDNAILEATVSEIEGNEITYYIRHKQTGEDAIIEEIDIDSGMVITQEKGEIRLVDVIENYEFRYDIW